MIDFSPSKSWKDKKLTQVLIGTIKWSMREKHIVTSIIFAKLDIESSYFIRPSALIFLKKLFSLSFMDSALGIHYMIGA